MDAFTAICLTITVVCSIASSFMWMVLNAYD